MPDINYLAVLEAGLGAPVAAAPVGCGRIYVIVPKAHAKGVAKAAKKLGMLFQPKAYYGFSNALYVGYDNATGKEIAKAKGIEGAFAAVGINTYLEYGAD